MRLLSRQGRINTLKTIALLSIVRWYNIFSILITQYLLAVFTINAHERILVVLRSAELHFTLFAFGLITAGGFMINNFYDAEKDLINRPKQTLFERLVSKNFLINAYLIFTISGLLITYTLSKQLFGLSLLFAFLLWFYSHKLKKKPLLGNISASVLMAFPMFALPLLYRDVTVVYFVYVGFLMIFDFNRRIVKDLTDYKGDLIFEYQTLPVAIGVESAKKIGSVSMMLSAIPLVSIVFIKGVSALSSLFFGMAVVILICAAILWTAKKDLTFQRINNAYKVLMGLTVVSILGLR